MTSFLATNSAVTSPINFYSEQAASEATYVSVCPAYYDHFRCTINKGIFEFTKPVKDGDAFEPFDPTNSFSLKDRQGNHITHAFIGIDATIVGYFIGAKLSNWEQQLPNERKGAHCETTRAVLQLGDGTEAIVNGRFPLQSSVGIHYNFRKYNADASAPGVYAGQRFMTSGKATPEFAAQLKRPEVMSCAECVAQNFDRFGNNSCKTTGEIAIYVRQLAIKGEGNKIVWLSVDDLNIEGLQDGFVAVLNLGASDLRKPDYRLDSKINLHIPPTVTFAHDYISGLYRRPNPALIPMIKTDLGLLQTVAYPTQLWVAELTKSYGSNKYCVLYNENTSKTGLGLEALHADLDQALTAYFNNKQSSKGAQESLQLLESPPLKAVVQDLAALTDLGGNSGIFQNLDFKLDK